MPACVSCGCKKNPSWYTFCKHCGHGLTNSSPGQHSSSAAGGGNHNGNGGVWKKWEGTWYKAPPGNWNWSAPASP
eukprot:7241983-Pyramimonas_sp.AAC.1